MSRKGPEKSATLYKIGTVKTGNDGNKWIVKASKNQIHKWILYKKTTRSNSSTGKKQYTASMLFAEKKNKSNNWYKKLNKENKFFIDTLRKSYKDFKSLGVIVYEYILHESVNNIFFIDEPWDAFVEKYPDWTNNTKSYVIPVIKIDRNNELYLTNNAIGFQHVNIKYNIKKNVLEYIRKFNSINRNIQIKWNGLKKANIDFIKKK